MRITAFTLFAVLAAAATPAIATAAPPMHTAASGLGSLAPYRAIAADTLTIIDQGNIPAARTRIRDLETRWDADEAVLKPKDKAAWTAVDKAIDNALAALRSPMSKPSNCVAALQALLAQIDAVNAG